MKLRPFELGLVVVFIILMIAALIIMARYEAPPDVPDGQTVIIGSVTIWGTMPQSVMDGLLVELREESDQYLNVSYRYFEPEAFDNALVNALADQRGPDLVLLSHEKLGEMRRRIQPFGYESFPVRDLRNLYLDGAQVFALSDGMYAFPIAVDPMVMYWNRDLLATEGFLEPPRNWESLINTYFPRLIRRDFDRSIQRGVVAMGEFENVRNSYGVVSSLLLQGGSGLVTETGPTQYQVQLQTGIGEGSNPLTNVASFYTRFADPSDTLYSWNRSFSSDRTEFVAEDLVFYFGYGSEGPQLERINPNLNFDIAPFPQQANVTVRRNYGKFYGLSLLRTSRNQAGAVAVLQNLGGQPISSRIARDANMVPMWRAEVQAGSNDIYGRVTYDSSFISYGWLNPDIESTKDAFNTMFVDINENRRSVGAAGSDLVNRLINYY